MRSERDYGAVPDTELTALTRKGELEAYRELWHRHERSGHLTASRFGDEATAQDLVAEAYLRILETIQRGGGPSGAFRPYLYTTIRNLARTHAKNPEFSVDDFTSLESLPGLQAEDPAEEVMDRSLLLNAFRSMPERWQTVLWYTEVEGMAPAQTAPLLGMSANAVAALAYRAREGLRSAWIQAHLNDRKLAAECRWVVGQLGAHARGRLKTRDRSRVDRHLTDCASCRLVAEEAASLAGSLHGVLLPVVLGAGAGALGLLPMAEGVSAGTLLPAAPIAASGLAAAPGGAAGAGAGGAANSGASGPGSWGIGSWVAAAAAAAAVVVGGVFGIVQLTGDAGETAAPPGPAAPAPAPPRPTPAPDPDADEGVEEIDPAPDAPDTETPAADPERPAPPVPDAPIVTAPSPGLLTNNPFSVFDGTAEPGARADLLVGSMRYGTTTVAEDGSWSILPGSRLPEGDITAIIRIRNSAGGLSSSSVQLTIDTIAPAVPALSGQIDPAGLLLPRLQVSGEPASTARLWRDSGSGPALVVVRTLDVDGDYDFGQVSVPFDSTSSFTVTLQDAAGNTSASSAALSVTTVPPPFSLLASTPFPETPGDTFQMRLDGPEGYEFQAWLERRYENPDPDAALEIPYLAERIDLCTGWPPCFGTTSTGTFSIQASGSETVANTVVDAGEYSFLFQYRDPSSTSPGPLGITQRISSLFTVAETE